MLSRVRTFSRPRRCRARRIFALEAPVRLWVAAESRSWRAFAPGFEELHENVRGATAHVARRGAQTALWQVVYQEREDEFDDVVLNDARGSAADAGGCGDDEAIDVIEVIDVLRPHHFLDADAATPRRPASIAVAPARNWPRPS